MARNHLIDATGHFVDGFAFATRHPTSVMLLGNTARAISHGGFRHRRNSGTTNTLMGLAAAALAMPVGIWLGRRIFG